MGHLSIYMQWLLKYEALKRTKIKASMPWMYKIIHATGYILHHWFLPVLLSTCEIIHIIHMETGDMEEI